MSSPNGHMAGPHTRRSRIEKDALGVREIPADAYWGIHTLRALENFPMSGIRVSSYPSLVKALAEITEASVLAEFDLDLIGREKKDAIVGACQEIAHGELLEHFIVDVIQDGAGTPLVMNAHEVIANRALDILGHDRGAYPVIDPQGDLNRRQTTAAVYSAASQIATIRNGLELLTEMAYLREQLARRQAQPAVPLTLKEEFCSFAALLDEDERGIRDALIPIHAIDLAGTGSARGPNRPEYQLAVLSHLRQITGLPLERGCGPEDASQGCNAYVILSAVLRRTAVGLSRFCSDLRLLSSRQQGEGVAINPVIPEAAQQAAFGVIGKDMVIAMAADEGQRHASAFTPIIAQSLLASLADLTSACTSLAERSINGIAAVSDAASDPRAEALQAQAL